MAWPACPRHWRLNCGAFQAGASGERLAAFAMLVRAGDLVWVQSFIGHGAALTDGVTKMLMFDIMEWLLARRDPCAQGVRWLVHGSMEEGAVGLFDWKRYLAFRPTILSLLIFHNTPRRYPGADATSNPTGRPSPFRDGRNPHQ